MPDKVEVHAIHGWAVVNGDDCNFRPVATFDNKPEANEYAAKRGGDWTAIEVRGEVVGWNLCPDNPVALEKAAKALGYGHDWQGKQRRANGNG